MFLVTPQELIRDLTKEKAVARSHLLETLDHLNPERLIGRSSHHLDMERLIGRSAYLILEGQICLPFC